MDKFPNHSVSIRHNPAERHTFNQNKQNKSIGAYEHYHDTGIREDITKKTNKDLTKSGTALTDDPVKYSIMYFFYFEIVALSTGSANVAPGNCHK